jgi:hypothetical protein
MSALDNSAGRGAYSLSGRLYEQSVRKYCGEAGSSSVQTWRAAGYTRLKAVVGIADDDDEALGAIARVGIRNQNDENLIEPFDVALGQPRVININLKEAVQIQISCTGRDSKTNEGRNYFHIVLGNGALFSS